MIDEVPRLRVPLSRRSWLSRLGRGSLKTRLAVTSALVIGICTAVTVTFAVRDAQTRAQQNVLDSNLGAGRIARTLETRLLEHQLMLSAVAKQWPAGADVTEERATAFLAGQMAVRVLFDRLFVVGTDGHVDAIGSHDKVTPVSLSVAGQPFFVKTLAEARPWISEPARNALGDGSLDIFMSAPAMEGTRVTAVVAAALTLPADNLLADGVRRDDGLLSPANTVVIDLQGRIISHPDKEWLMRDVSSEPRLARAVRDWIDQGRPMEAEPWAVRSGNHFVGMAAVPGADWMVIRYASADELLGRAMAASFHTAYLGMAVAAMGALFIMVVMAWMLRPMHRLETRALRLLDPASPADLPWPDAKGEIGDLTAVFQHVIHALATSHRHTDEMLDRMQAVMSHAPIGISFTRRGVFELASQHYCTMFGHEGKDLVGQHHGILFQSEDVYRAMANRVATQFVAGRVFREEVEFKRRDGTLFWGLLLGAAVHPGNPLAGSIWIVSDATEMRQRREKLFWTASHDPLTDLVNRREFEERLGTLLADRRHTEDISTLFIDLDGFKAVNDNGGHAAGDEILRLVSHALTERVREQDTVARLGGDEFAILLRVCPLDQALAVAEQIRERIQQLRLDWQGLNLGVTASIGVVSISDCVHTVDAVVAAADKACYEAKHAGRNTVRAYRPESEGQAG